MDTELSSLYHFVATGNRSGLVGEASQRATVSGTTEVNLGQFQAGAELRSEFALVCYLEHSSGLLVCWCLGKPGLLMSWCICGGWHCVCECVCMFMCGRACDNLTFSVHTCHVIFNSKDHRPHGAEWPGCSMWLRNACSPYVCVLTMCVCSPYPLQCQELGPFKLRKLCRSHPVINIFGWSRLFTYQI